MNPKAGLAHIHHWQQGTFRTEPCCKGWLAGSGDQKQQKRKEEPVTKAFDFIWKMWSLLKSEMTFFYHYFAKLTPLRREATYAFYCTKGCCIFRWTDLENSESSLPTAWHSLLSLWYKIKHLQSTYCLTTRIQGPVKYKETNTSPSHFTEIRLGLENNTIANNILYTHVLSIIKVLRRETKELCLT